MHHLDNNQRILSLDCLRIIAMFAVVVLHASAQNFTAVSWQSFE